MTRACDSCTDHDQRNLQRERVTVSEEYLKDITNVLLESVEKTCQGSDRAPLERERETEIERGRQEAPGAHAKRRGWFAATLTP
jgi:hypothetical protein